MFFFVLILQTILNTDNLKIQLKDISFSEIKDNVSINKRYINGWLIEIENRENDIYHKYLIKVDNGRFVVKRSFPEEIKEFVDLYKLSLTDKVLSNVLKNKSFYTTMKIIEKTKLFEAEIDKEEQNIRLLATGTGDDLIYCISPKDSSYEKIVNNWYIRHYH